ncbi:FAD-dependent oxidoreductase [Actinopolymorpha sp. NPDC004070]|uniref:NAD(P)/FAD-dependent oxidoreductase n=1 Tax=Actinopolymorpha sp. NPDC004070 TaxID=3154548 RepID=UPI0033AFFD9B
MPDLGPPADVVIVGAGVVGAACAYYAARAGLDVVVVDAGTIAGGTTGSGEGNLLVSDKEPGPELDLALTSLRLWHELAEDLAPADVEYDPKGGVVVAETPDGLVALTKLADAQRSRGVLAEQVDGAGLAELEPHLAPGLAGGVHYPQDAQVQPMLAAACLLRRAREHAARVHTGVRVTGIDQGADGRVTGIVTTAGRLAAGAVVNAAGTWSGEVASLAGVPLPIQPRRGFILVTEPLPPLIRHKVYDADYVANVASSSAGLETSTVVEGTRGGTILIGASRERVGFDRALSVPVLSRLAAQAMRLFPFLDRVSVIRAYRGFRPYLPDHLPVIGPDPRVEGLFHACGHEGAGVGLAPVTGSLVAAALTGTEPAVGLGPFRADRFDAVPPGDVVEYEEQPGEVRA